MKGLEALDRIKNNKYSHWVIATNPPIDKDSEDRAEDYKVIEKNLKALDIIINKKVDVNYLVRLLNIKNLIIEQVWQEYNNNVSQFASVDNVLELEEVILLKEMLKNGN